MSTLLTCPFCGDSALLQGLGEEHNVICTNCHVQTPDFATAAEAIAAWNRRPGPDQTATSDPVDIKQRLDRIEARQIVLYSKLAAYLTPEDRAFLFTEWNAVNKGE